MRILLAVFVSKVLVFFLIVFHILASMFYMTITVNILTVIIGQHLQIFYLYVIKNKKLNP